MTGGNGSAPDTLLFEKDICSEDHTYTQQGY